MHTWIFVIRLNAATSMAVLKVRDQHQFNLDEWDSGLQGNEIGAYISITVNKEPYTYRKRTGMMSVETKGKESDPIYLTPNWWLVLPS